MKTCIVYMTTHGCTEKCARELNNQLDEDADLFNVKQKVLKDLRTYDTVIIGGSIHAGHVQRKIKTFCEKHESLLLEKKLGLFLCCMEEGEKAKEQFDNAFPEKLRHHAMANGLFGGEFDFNSMGFLAKSIIKKMAKVEENVDKISHESIAEFAAKMR